ncbi:MAG: DUF6345 domain-containing protein, partial [Verrucomicrobiota bacterium]
VNNNFRGTLQITRKLGLGLLIGHGIRGIGRDYTTAANGPKTTYYPVFNKGATAYDYVRLSEMDLGSQNLRWMAILACNMLNENNYTDMWNKLALPINDSLHLLCSAKTGVYMVEDVGRVFADSLTGKATGTAMKVTDSWYAAGTATQMLGKPDVNIYFRVAGWGNCFNDTIYSYEDPDSGNPADITYEDVRVFPQNP